MADGSWRLMRTRATQGGGRVVTFVDITALKLRADELAAMAAACTSELEAANANLQREVEERRRAEAAALRARRAAERADQAKTVFLSGMWHEIRTPLNSILGFAELLERHPARGGDAELAEYPQSIRDAGEHLLAIIDEVLDLAALEAGALSVTLAPVDLDDVLTEALAVIRPLAAARRIEIERPAGEIPGPVVADCLRQVLINLLSDAIKYNVDGGEVRFGVTLEGSTCRIAITDTGPGVPPDRLNDLFKPFSRLGAEYTSVGGSGIGLHMAKNLTELMAGEIGVESEATAGATFWLRFPCSPKAGHSCVDT